MKVIPCHAIACHGIACHGIASHGIASHGIASHGIASHGIACHGIACHGIACHGIACHSINHDVECPINNLVDDIVAVPQLESTSGSEITSFASRSSDMSLSRLETFIEDAFIGFVPEPGLEVKLIELKNVVDKNKIDLNTLFK